MSLPLTTASGRVTDADMPQLFRVADRNSMRGQRRYLLAVRLRLLALVVGAAFGVLSWSIQGTDYAGVVAAAAFGAAIIAEVYLLRERPERIWYAGRAVAESVKTLTWAYMVGGGPFSHTTSADTAPDNRLLDSFAELARDARSVWLVPDSGELNQITATMRHVRAKSLEQRREIYLRDRLLEQRDWYARKAQWNDRRATIWGYALTLIEFAGLTFGVLKAASVINIDLLGLAAAVVGAGATWLQVKQHQNLSAAYALTCHELTTIAERVTQPDDEEEWAAYVTSAEAAISREHTMWRASHATAG